jgi:ABC-type glycerol-3-phosphate transport system permease component
MSKERRILSWSALVASILVCCPCAALSGFVAFIGGYSMLGSTSSVPSRSDLFNMIAFGTVSMVALVVGLALLVWGARSLLNTEDVATGSATGSGPNPGDGGNQGSSS